MLLSNPHYLKVLLDENGVILEFKCTLRNIVAFNHISITGMNWFDLFIEKKDKIKAKELFIASIKNSTTKEWLTFENDVKCLDGKHLSIDFINKIGYKDSKKVLSMHGIEHKDNISINHPVVQVLIDTIPNPIIITNGLKIEKANQTFLNILNYATIEEFTNTNNCVCELFIKYEEYFTIDKINSDTIWTDYIYDNNSTVKVAINTNDEIKFFEITINKLYDDLSHYIVVFTDITAIENEKKLLKQLAYTDPLTKIYNRKMFDMLLNKEKENIKRHKDRSSLILIDIDHFKNINDTYGHDIGDKVLKRLTKLISKNIRVNDIFARWGGEEFILLLPRTPVELAFEKAKQLRKLIENCKSKNLPNFTISAGVTEILETDKKQSCFKRVDKALYKAKIKRNDVILVDNKGV